MATPAARIARFEFSLLYASLCKSLKLSKIPPFVLIHKFFRIFALSPPKVAVGVGLLFISTSPGSDFPRRRHPRRLRR